jgi:DNA polymerase III delta subunit
VAKLVAYDSKITSKTVEELVEKRPEDTIFQLLEYALSGKTSQALGVLEGLEKAHEDPFQTASMLIWQTNILAIVHSAKDVSDSEIAKTAKLNPFVVKKTRLLAARLTKAKLRQIIDAVSLLDVTLKTTSTDPWRLVERSVLSV